MTAGQLADCPLPSRHRLGRANVRHLARVAHHAEPSIDVAENYAGNVRLFEATGCGALLVTDWKTNLDQMFEPGKEIVAYARPRNASRWSINYLNHDQERKAIADAGQQRTLRDHTFHHRMHELADIVAKQLSV